ncbi:putative Ig domain-containing protein [Streptomyces sp. LP11]|uniref:Ig domain-containing protein n=1 Tax=Streptomyces pyxinicus TaxID=2970331 RepID=A0ABT2B4Z0_9ACTN|nr:alkaline phosphatase family protein [Streptomyces sp. LP11]MCS0603596.1 putative Ig domain-containing protein [Streptomyces sp. LP11]
MRSSRIATLAGATVLTVVTALGMLPSHQARHLADTPVASAVPQFDHVVVVMFENKNYSTIKGGSSAPYLNSLATQGTLFTNAFGITHPSQPNYISLFSGSQQGVSNDDCVTSQFKTGNLGQQLLNAGRTFKGYSEGLPSAGYTGCSSGNYRSKHAPWVDFPTVSGSAYNVPYSTFPSDYGKLPTVSFVIPDMCNDMHDCSVGTGDGWIKKNLDGYAQWAKTHNSLLLATFDEDNFTSVNQIYTVAVGAHVKAGYQSGTQIDHFNVLRTIEDMYGLTPLGNAANKSPITDAWTSSTSALAVTDPGAHRGRAGQADSLQLSASGGTTPYTWSAAGLPAGLSIDSATGRVSGTPTTSGSSSVTATVKDAAGATASTTFTWTVTASGGGTVVFTDDFESDQGWRVNGAGSDTATSGAFERGVARQTTSTHSNQVKQLPAASGSYALTTGAAAGSAYGDNDLDGGRTTVFSPSITLPTGGPLALRFSYNVANGDNSGADDYLRVRVLDGTTPTTVFEQTGSASEVAGQWRTATADLSAFAGKSVRVYLEAADDGTASLFEAQVDDLSITQD